MWYLHRSLAPAVQVTDRPQPAGVEVGCVWRGGGDSLPALPSAAQLLLEGLPHAITG